MAANAPAIGVVGSPDIAQSFTALGFRVITGDGFRDGATAISNALGGKSPDHDGSPFPVVLVDVHDTALKPWAKLMLRQSARLVVVAIEGGGGALEDVPENRLEAPATFNDLLAKIGYQHTPAALGSKYIQSDGSLGDLPPGRQPEPEPEPMPMPVALPTFAEPEPEPEPAEEKSLDDLFNSAPQQAQTTALDDLFNAPSQPAPVAQQAPQIVPQPAPQPAADPSLDALFSGMSSTPTPAPVPQPQVQPEPVIEEPEYAPLAPAPAPAPEPVRHSIEDDEAAFFRARSGVAEDAPRRRHIGKRGDVIIVGAGKGGVGKSTTSIMLAQAAAEAGMSVVLIDANRGQPDIAKYLRLLGAPNLRTVFDAYQQQDPAAALMKPEDYAHARERARLDPTPFGVVLGPPSDLADPRYASARVYGDIVDYARSIADLVVIDTQIAEAAKSDLWSDMLIPLLAADAWFVGITDESGPGASNLADRLIEIRDRGVTSARTLVLASKHLTFDEEHLAFYSKRFADLGKVIGSTGYDDDFHVKMKLGEIDSDSPSIRPTIDSILYQVTGREDLRPRPVQKPAKQKSEKKRFSLFGKKN